MRKRLLLLFSILLSTTTSIAQNKSDASLTNIDKFKKYIVLEKQIDKEWSALVIGFNETCDRISFKGQSYNTSSFNVAFSKFLSSKLKPDTTVIYLDYGDHLTLNLILCSLETLTKQIEKPGTVGTYYFTTEKQKEQSKIATIDINPNKTLRYNGEYYKKPELLKLIRSARPDLVIIRADEKVPVAEVIDILEITEKIGVKIKLETSSIP